MPAKNIVATRYDGVPCTLCNQGNEPVTIGQKVEDFRGDKAYVFGGTAPHGPDKAGYVYTSRKKTAKPHEWDRHYCRVWALEWVPEVRRQFAEPTVPKLDLKEKFPRSVTVTEKVIQFREGDKVVNSLEYRPGRLERISDTIAGWNEWSLSGLDLFAELGPIKNPANHSNQGAYGENEPSP